MVSNVFADDLGPVLLERALQHAGLHTVIFEKLAEDIRDRDQAGTPGHEAIVARCCMPVKTEEPAMKMKTLFDNSLFEEFMGQALEKFELHLKNEGIKQNPLEQRMRGAREFAVFLLGRGHRKGERTKGRI